MDYISKLPQSIIGNILCLLPIQEAARTSVLASEWQYHWTKIPKVVLDEDSFQVSDDEISVVFDDILNDLSKGKTVKNLTLKCSSEYTLPQRFFKLTRLTHLYLEGCEIDHIPTSSGFGELTHLYVHELWITTENLIKLLSKSPLLKTVTMNMDLDQINKYGNSTVINLFKCLPVIENLSVSCDILHCFGFEDEVPQKLETALVHVKYFCLQGICFTTLLSDIHTLALVIRSSPNLEKLKVEITHDCCEEDLKGLFKTEYYSDIWLKHLNELEIINVGMMEEAELDFVRLILAKSPVLNKVKIFLYDKYEKSFILEILSTFPHESPDVAITVEHESYFDHEDE